jgi:primase-polymerase (primpol)-like protein
MTTKLFSHKQLLEALYSALDIMDRAMIPFFLIGDTAKQVVNKEEELSGDGIHIGIKQKDIHASGLSVLNMLKGLNEGEENSYILTHEGVPIYVQVFKSKNSVIDAPDRVFYGYESFNVPNPMDKYLKIKHLLK